MVTATGSYQIHIRVSDGKPYYMFYSGIKRMVKYTF